MSDLRTAFDETGRVWFRNALGAECLDLLERETVLDARPGARVQMAPALTAAMDEISNVLTPLRSGCFATRIVSFDKTENANWGLPWHQDRVIAVAAKRDVEGFENWSQKAGQWHCEPPVEVLNSMLFVRVHLDDCDAENGAMEIAPCSHRAGKLAKADIPGALQKCSTEICTAQRGDVLALHMLVLHRSRPSKNKVPRRVLRVDFANATLAGLEWAGSRDDG